ncbi:MAG TPA: LysR family transcriptional regulator [Rhodopila sp.]|uniref:LysR family transcriptional regulator n=1 Tax=Rhodopila sp. TaxID=2480087 RepID=UPI002C8BCD69|nr:LysR family transcriptional regulator [Rhodopila sp.]HVY15761.1 LysR family transcriptional regulator [Rhodopila sp.]
MDTRDLRYFIAAAESGHLHQAAERIGRSQPALSKCIRRLEAEVGARLFEPSGRGIKLTDVGHALLGRARLLVQGMQDTVREMTDLAQGIAGHVRLGSGPTTAEWLLPGLCRRLLRESPGLTLEVKTGLGDVLRQGLREGRLDLAITPLAPDDAVEFNSVAIAGDTMVAAVRPGHPLDREGVLPEDLDRYAWLLPAGRLASTDWLMQRVRALGLGKPRVQVEADTVIMLRRVVSETDLLTFLSRRDLLHGPALREVMLPDLTYHRSIGALSVRGRHPSPAMARVAALLEELAEVG